MEQQDIKIAKSVTELRKEARKSAVAILMENPEYSNVLITKMTGCRYETVRLLRKSLETAGVIDIYDARNGGRNAKQKDIAHLVAPKNRIMMEEREVTVSWVYAIGPVDGGLTKIGLTLNVESRLAALQSSSPLQLEVLWQKLGDRSLEERLHGIFSDRRAWGEWFDLGTDPVQAITFALKWWDENPPYPRSQHDQS